MTDWRDLPAGRDLDLYIAEQIGFTRKAGVRRGTSALGGYPMLAEPGEKIDGYFFCAPDGSFVDDETLNEVFYHNFPEWEKVYGPLPNYSTDANAALALPIDKNWYLCLTGGGSVPGFEWWAEIKPGNTGTDGHHPQHEGETPALAICRAWLAWKEQQK